MNLKKTIKTFAISLMLAVAAVPAHGQDLLARQAPVDRKMAAVDTIMLRSISVREESESPASELYANWDNRYAHRATELPENYRIDLRHFCMPTTSRVITSNFGSRWGRQHKGLASRYISVTLSALHSQARFVLCVTRVEVMANTLSSVTTMALKPYTAIYPSSWFRRTKRFALAML